MIVCQNCGHRRSFHKKVDGNAKCSVKFCPCEKFIEPEVLPERRKIHEALDKFLDAYTDK